jgi:methylglyoxal synthase
MQSSNEKPTIAFITTKEFRTLWEEELEAFCYSHLFFLCSNFDVVTTGGTFDELQKYIDRSFSRLTNDNRVQISADWNRINKTKLKIRSDSDLTEWKATIRAGLKSGNRPAKHGVKGMIDIISRLVDGKISAVIHLTDWQDKSAKPDTAVLSREANVHDIPIATNVTSAEVFIEQWHTLLPCMIKPVCPISTVKLDAIFDAYEKDKSIKVLAMISHNGKKTAMDLFTAEHMVQILKNNYILATESTGERILRLMKAITGVDYCDKVCCCKPGPKGGDLQIAQAVVKGVCTNIVFFQDPEESQPHDADIRLFEQAVTTPGVHARLATNPSSAKLLIDWLAKL